MDRQLYENQKKKKKILIFAIAVVVIAAIVIGIVAKISDKDQGKITISVGSKAFTEQQILGHILADVIEMNSQYTVERKIGLGGTSICWEALVNGSIDMYVEYSAGMFMNHLKQEFQPITKDEIIEIIRPLLLEKGVVLGQRLGFNNDYELTVTRKYAEEKGLKTIADLKALANDIVVAPTFEYVNRPDGMQGVNSIYGIEFANVTPMEAGLRYSALNTGKVQVINTFTTDGMKYKLDLVALKDPKNVHLAQEACIIINKQTADKHPALLETLAVLEEAITPEAMMEMNYKVDVEGKTPEEVAAAFVESLEIQK